MRVLKWVGIALGVVLLLPAGFGAFAMLARPVIRPASAERIDSTPDRLARGTYLVEHLLPCVSCHSDHDAELYALPVKAGGYLSGGLVLDRSFGLPGVFQSPNITPDVETGIGSWTDGEVMRSLREGIHKSGRALFPMMPYPQLDLSDEDAKSIVVYLRSIPPIRRKTAPIEIDFPVSLFIRMVPQPLQQPVPSPDRSSSAAYGAYLVKAASCGGCHTPIERGRPVEGMEFAGGREFPIPTSEGRFRAVTTNITPAGYFGRATKDEWIGRVRAYAELLTSPQKSTHGWNTLMPWLEYSGLTDDDLGAIYDYMKTVPAIEHEVDPFPDAPTATRASAPPG